MVRRRQPERKERRANTRDLSVPETELVLEVLPEHDDQRLDQFLAIHLPWRSKTFLQSWIRQGSVKIDGRPSVKKSTRIKAFDKVRVELPEPNEEIRHEEIARSLEVIYEDPDVVAINKSPGLVVHPVSKVRYNTLIQALHWHYRHGPGTREAGVVPKICHRLDRDTSGVILLAKTDPSRRALQEIFESRQMEKRYRTLLWGTLEAKDLMVDAPIGLNQHGEHALAMAVRDDGLPSRSLFNTLQVFELGDRQISEVEVRILTGRQHQIRVHSAHLGHPVLCDSLYGLGETSLRVGDHTILERQALHAAYLSLKHPRRDEPLSLAAGLPSDITETLAHLQRGESLTW